MSQILGAYARLFSYYILRES